jgi:hypothetical protein
MLRGLSRPFQSVGQSAGALPVLTLPAARLILIEPVLVTGPLWPLRERFAALDDPLVAEVFGYPGPGKDPVALVDGLSVQTIVMVGDEALGEPRPLTRLPSLVLDRERAMLASHPLVELLTIEGAGHDALLRSGRLLIDLLRREAPGVNS